MALRTQVHAAYNRYTTQVHNTYWLIKKHKLPQTTAFIISQSQNTIILCSKILCYCVAILWNMGHLSEIFAFRYCIMTTSGVFCS
jgi:PIN domain nuclease of toxin-antitoxin system